MSIKERESFDAAKYLDDIEIGMAISHALHGNGFITDLPKRMVREREVQFVQCTFYDISYDWEDIVQDDVILMPAGANEDSILRLLIPLDRFLTSDQFSIRPGVQGPEIGNEIKTIAKVVSAPASDDSSPITRYYYYAKKLEQAFYSADSNEMVNIVVATSTWAVDCLLYDLTNQRGAKKKEIVETYRAQLGTTFWQNVVYPSIPQIVRGNLDPVLVALASKAAVPTRNEHLNLNMAAREIIDSLEYRLESIYRAKLDELAGHLKQEKSSLNMSAGLTSGIRYVDRSNDRSEDGPVRSVRRAV